jgi:hypothetical protein
LFEVRSVFMPPGAIAASVRIATAIRPGCRCLRCGALARTAQRLEPLDTGLAPRLAYAAPHSP